MDFVLGLRNIELHVEIQALNPVIVVEIVSWPEVAILIRAGDLEITSERCRRVLNFSDGNGGRYCTNYGCRRERCLAYKLLDPAAEDVFDRITRARRLCIIGVIHGFGDCDIATPHRYKVASESASYCWCTRRVCKIVALPLQEWISVAWIILRIDELDC